MRAMRFVRCVLVAAGGTVGMFLIPSTAQVVHAYTGNGTCVGSAQATAISYDGTLSGSSRGEIRASGYSPADCVGLAQTHAIFHAGNACENAGIPAGMSGGSGYALVSWFMSWWDGYDDFLSLGLVDQQYDCADTFS